MVDAAPGPADALERFQRGVAEHAAAFRRLAAPLRGAPASVARLVQILRVIRQLTETERFAADFGAPAERLRDLGFPELHRAVAQTLLDVREGEAQLAGMYRTTAAALYGNPRVVGEAQDAELRGLVEAIADARRGFDDPVPGGADSGEHACTYCGLYFGSAMAVWHWCPRCGTRLEG